MNNRKGNKEIKSVNVKSNCIEAEPCEHKVKIKFKDGSEETHEKEVSEIVKNYGDYLDKEKVSRIDCFASFFPSNKFLPTDNQCDRNQDNNFSHRFGSGN